MASITLATSSVATAQKITVMYTLPSIKCIEYTDSDLLSSIKSHFFLVKVVDRAHQVSGYNQIRAPTCYLMYDYSKSFDILIYKEKSIHK